MILCRSISKWNGTLYTVYLSYLSEEQLKLKRTIRLALAHVAVAAGATLRLYEILCSLRRFVGSP